MRIAVSAASALLIASAGSASADIVSLTNGTANWQQLSGPVDFSTGGSDGDNTTYIFQEQTGLTLGSDLTVDIAGDGGFTGSGDPGSETIAAGTRVESYIIQFNPSSPAGSGGVAQSNMSVEFDTPILGLIGKTPDLTDTDGLLGDSESTYGPIYDFRGTWDTPSGFDSASVIGNELSFSWESNPQYGEQFRVLTLAPAAVPEPSSMILLGLTGLGGAGLGWHRRRRMKAEESASA